MKRQITAVITAALILANLTACRNNGIENQSNNQGSITDNAALISDDQSSISQNQNSDISSNLNSPENPESKNEQSYPIEQVTQILKPLKEYGDLCWKMFPYDLNKELVDMEQTISAERPTSAGTMTRTFYKVVNGDIKTEEQFIAKIDTMLTEKAKKEFLADPERNFEFSDGNLYISGRGAGGMGTGMDALYLDSVEYTDENTVVVTVISLGDKNNWGTSEDIKDAAKATLVKTDDGFRIDTCDYSAIIDFYFYNEIICDDKTIPL